MIFIIKSQSNSVLSCVHIYFSEQYLSLEVDKEPGSYTNILNFILVPTGKSAVIKNNFNYVYSYIYISIAEMKMCKEMLSSSHEHIL
jgi:hypothetical protein